MQQSPNEQEVINQAQRGDEEAVTLLYETHVDAIFEYVRYRVDSKSTAEDLTSEVFLRMVRGLANYQSQGVPFRAWLFRIAANLVIDHYRQRKKGSDAPLLDDYASDDTDPFDRLADSENQLRLQLAIRALPEVYQDLLLLRFVENLPHTEIAKIMNKSAAALRAMQHRALKALAEQFERLNENHSSQQGEER
ncbi:MAG TPA: sigma-70 family RNA polymerase sigma factor [Terriglobales bacterium]|nr:sigma-70 family RNA polymerase sigma factor [Terriglobales bacterium]